jgi:hypothetical protein
MIVFIMSRGLKPARINHRDLTRNVLIIPVLIACTDWVHETVTWRARLYPRNKGQPSLWWVSVRLTRCLHAFLDCSSMYFLLMLSTAMLMFNIESVNTEKPHPHCTICICHRRDRRLCQIIFSFLCVIVLMLWAGCPLSDVRAIVLGTHFWTGVWLVECMTELRPSAEVYFILICSKTGGVVGSVVMVHSQIALRVGYVSCTSTL